MGDTVPSPEDKVYFQDLHVTGWRVVAALLDFVPLTALAIAMALGKGHFGVEVSSWGGGPLLPR